MEELPPEHIQKTIFEAMSLTDDGIGVFDTEDKLIFCNESFAVLFGMSEKQAIGQSFGELITNSYTLRQGVNVETTDVDEWLSRANAKRRSVNFRTFEVDTCDGRWFLFTEQVVQGDCLYVYCSDITAKKDNEKKLQQVSDSLFKLASIDSLTQVYNRRHFYHLAEIELDRCQRNNSHAALMMIDLDDFKQFNDNHGHAVGDLILTTFAENAATVLRSYDIFGRIGGEEFAVLLPETSSQEALVIAERLRASTESLTVPYQHQSLCMTISIGVAHHSSAQPSLELMLNDADRLLYCAKEEGRNCIRHPGGPVESGPVESGPVESGPVESGSTES